MTQQLLAPPLPAVTLADVERISARNEDPDWLREARLDAFRLYESLDLPDPGDEQWRRTDVGALDLEGLREQPAAVDIELPPAAIGQGVVAMPLATAARSHDALLRDRLYSVVGPDEWKYVALNAALWSGGALIYVPKGVEVAEPLHVGTSASAGTLAFPRLLVVAEQHSRLVLIDESASPGGARSFVSGAVEIIAGDGASVEYYDVNRWGDQVYNFKTVRAVLGRDARFLAMAAGIGSALTKMRIDTLMPQPGARAELLGVTFGSGAQHFDYNTLQDHRGDHTVSDLQFKSALTGSAALIWYGVTRINPGASAAEANQTSRNLLLSDHAKAVPIPILEIEAYDVAKCSHGATAGPVDENELFYLQARGIPRHVAERMLVEGFFADVIARVPGQALRQRLMAAVLEKAGGSAGTLSLEEVLSA
jgi:Fe-S cluster assembly protein SufD